MNLTQLLAWLSGPGVGSALSYVLDQWQPWHDWKPADKLGFDAKAALITVGSLALGFVAYQVALRVPQATIDALDPYVAAGFPFVTFLAVQIWHVLVNKRLEASAGVTTTVAVTESTPTGAIMTTVSGPSVKMPDATASVAGATGLSADGEGKG